MLEDKSFVVLDVTEETMNKILETDEDGEFSGYVVGSEIIPEDEYNFNPNDWVTRMQTQETGVSFRPLRGTEEKILAGPAIDGYIYFATDTGKIFLAKDYEFIPMGGGGVAVLYADGEVVDNNNETYTIQQSSLLDETVTPKEDDLIINSDGRFFKVTYYDKIGETMTCKLIAVSGSGGSGGDGSGGGGDSAQNITVVYHNSSMSFLKGDKFYIDFTATGPEGVSSMYLEYSVYSAAGGNPKVNSMQITSGQRVSIEVGEYMRIGNNRVEITISAMGANNYFKKISGIRMVSMNVETDLDEFSNYAIYNSNFTYYVKYYTSNNATLKVLIDGEQVASKAVGASVSSAGSKDFVNINPGNLNLAAGTHIISAYLEEAGGFRSDATEIDFIYHPAGSENAVYIVLTDYPKEILSYEIPDVKFWVYDTSKESGAMNEIIYSVNGVIIDTVQKAQIEGKEYGLNWLVTGLEADTMNTCTIRVGQDTERTFEIYVEKSNIFDPTESGAVLLLSADGRTNDTSLERRTQWQYTNQFGKTISAKFNDFNWENNGWVFDENEGRTCLRISNGANIEIPLRLFYDYSSAGTSGYTLEFEFKPYNLYSYNSLSKVIDTIEDEAGDVIGVIRSYDMLSASITYALSSGKEAAGFGLGTQDAFFRMASTGDTVSAQYIENEIINVALVINTNKQQMMIYLNGILSGMTGYTNPTEALPIGISKILINSNFADIDLYSIRCYNRALNSTEISQNYISSKKDLELYKQNQLGAVDNTVKYDDLVKYNEENPENCTIPYIVFKTKSNPDVLPFNKENDDIMVDILFKNVAADYKLANSAKSASDIEEYLKHAPSFEAKDVRLNVQGTSSQKYPRKNFKGKMLKEDTSTITCTNAAIPVDKKEMSKLYLNPDAGEKTFTWKADYMDSSGKHNTGFTSFVKEVYNKHPLDYYFGTDGDYYKNYRTTIFGFPVLAFHEKSNGDVEFIGRYNFNLDKSCETSIGMKIDDVHPILGEKIKKIAECWEFGNNTGDGRCAFRYKNDFFENIWQLIEDLEPRYHNDGDLIENAFEQKDEDGETPISEEEAVKRIKDKYQHLAKLMEWVKSTYCGFDLTNPADQILAKIGMGLAANEEECENVANISPDDPAFISFKNERIKKFQDEFLLHFNPEYCALYFVMTEFMVLFDSRGKNMMLGSWGPIEENGEYIWFPLFYDVDTQLGIDNSGYPTMEYNIEPTEEGQFSTSTSLFWRSYDAAFGVEIRNKYREIRNSARLSINQINAYYDFDESKSIAMKGILPISVINADAFYKYILPSYSVRDGGGYVTGLDNSGNPIYTTSSKYFYCIQGTRDLYRNQFLRNRFNFYDSKWIAGDYSGGLSGDKLRVRGETVNSSDDSIDSSFILHITPVLDQYVTAFADEVNAESLYEQRVKVKAGETGIIDLNNIIATSKDQIVSIPGASFIQKLGDLSLFYLNAIELPPNINEIYLGNSNPNYKPSDEIEAVIKQVHGETGQEVYPLLKEYDITNLPVKNFITLEGSPKLESFKALGSLISGVSFAKSVDLERVFLPNTITSLQFYNASKLDKIIFNITDENEKGFFIKELVHKDINNNDVILLENINIENDNFKQYGYHFIKTIVDTKKAMSNIDNLEDKYHPYLGLNLVNVTWSPYNKIGEGAEYEQDKINNYYYANNDFTLSKYEYSTLQKWELDIANERVYEYIHTDVELMKDLTILDDLINNNYGFVKNYKEGLSKDEMGKPYISGEIYIDNVDPISETDITNYYNVHFPDLKIKVANIKPSNRIRFVQRHEPTMGKTEKELSVLRFDEGDYSPSKIVVPNIPQIIHYDSSDIWEYEENGEVKEVKTEKLASIINNFASGNEFTFYTKYVRHPYKITFYYDDEEEPYVKDVLYNDFIGMPTEIYPYKDASKLALTQVYKFEYYVAKEGSAVKAELESIKATRDMEFWAYFTEDSVYNNVISEDYFYISNGLIINRRTNDAGIGADTQAINAIFKGKITLPTDGAESVSTSLLQLARGVTHVFFEKSNNSSLTRINDYAFNYLSNVIYIEIPNTVTSIGNNAFSSCQKVKYIGPPTTSVDMSERLVKLAGNITTLGFEIFNYNGTFKELTIGTSESDLWQIIDDSTIVDNVSGDAKFNSLIVYRDPISQSFITIDWLTSKFGVANQTEIKPA